MGIPSITSSKTDSVIARSIDVLMMMRLLALVFYVLGLIGVRSDPCDRFDVSEQGLFRISDSAFFTGFSDFLKPCLFGTTLNRCYCSFLIIAINK